MIRLYHRFLSLLDALAAEPVWRRSLVAYLAVSAFLWTAAALAHAEHGIVMAMRLPIAVAVPFVVVTYAVASVIREILTTPAYFVALAGILLAVSRFTPGERVSFRQLFSVTVHVGYILLAGHALRVALALGGVELGGTAATLLPDPDAMFLPDPAEPVPAGSHSTSFSGFAGSPADIPAVGAFDTVFHALLGVAYCRIRGRRLIFGAAWGAGLSLLVDVVWLLLRITFA
ncbi:hypothetical protein [Candidatus Palauibacter irciniicola]|uniref:hypothetical protein n=1 Tax=Candidatus Palauibacter irciniicola TaxID=3056733 RepID=UPI003B023E32